MQATHCQSIRVTSYNVLADAYATKRLYPAVLPDILHWRNRGPLIASRVNELTPDVACLQEIEAVHWSALRESLVPLGRDGIFAQKGRSRVDGCALVFRIGAATLKHSQAIHFTDGTEPSGHLALTGLFATAIGVVRITTTHLRWQADSTDPQAHVGYRQATELLTQLSAANETAATVICGDFNVPPSHPILRLFSDRGFADAYAASPQSTCAPNGRPARIDYIFVSQGLSAAGEPLSVLENATVLPNGDQPSDHLPITARVTRR